MRNSALQPAVRRPMFSWILGRWDCCWAESAHVSLVPDPDRTLLKVVPTVTTRRIKDGHWMEHTAHVRRELMAACDGPVRPCAHLETALKPWQEGLSLKVNNYWCSQDTCVSGCCLTASLRHASRAQHLPHTHRDVLWTFLYNSVKCTTTMVLSVFSSHKTPLREHEERSGGRF